jgi:MFS family permease
MPWREALRIPALWRMAAIGACYTYSIGFFVGWLQTYLVKGRGFTEAALVLSSLTYAVGAMANVLGGLVGDWLVTHNGLRIARRWVGAAGQCSAALFLIAAVYSPDSKGALVFLSLAYGAILFQQPSIWALCLDVAQKNTGAVFAFVNTACSITSAISAVVFGILVTHFGNYNTPFFPMVALLFVGALLWTRVDPTCELFPEARLVEFAAPSSD